MVYKWKLHIIITSLFIFYLFPSSSFAASQTICGTGGCFTYDPVTKESNCSQITSESSTSNLTPCIDELGPYENTCCRQTGGCTAAGDGSSLRQWDWNYASKCTAKKSTFSTQCNFQLIYETVTCKSTDTCRNEPYLYPGLCTDNGCAISPTKYKVCCATNAVGGVCEGGNYSGTCPNGTEEKFCGFGSYPACNSPVVCGTPAAPPPAPSQAPPPPGAPNLSSFGGVACFSNGYTANLSWSGTPFNTGSCGNGFWVDISTSSNFSSGKYHKCVSGNSTTSPDGFNGYEGASGSLTLAKGSIYYARVFNGTHSNTVSLTVPGNDCDPGQSGGFCGAEITGTITSPGSASAGSVMFSGTYFCHPGQCVESDYGFKADPNQSYVSINGQRQNFANSDPATNNGIGGGQFKKQVNLSPGSYQVYVHIEGFSDQWDRNFYVELPNVGNPCSGSGNLTVTGDTQAPTCGYLHLNNSTASTVHVKQGGTVDIDFSIIDNTEVATVEVFRGANKINTFNNTLHTKPAYQVSAYKYNTATLAPGTYTIAANAVDTANNPMLNGANRDPDCVKQLVIDPSSWVPPTCTNGVFSGCKLQGGADCSDAGPGNPQYDNWTPSMQQMCSNACAAPNNPQSRNLFCGQNSLSVSPKSVSKIAGNWDQMTIRPIMGTVTSGNILRKFGEQTATGSCSGNLCNNWDVVQNNVAASTASITWTPPQSMTPGTYTFALFNANNTAILATDTADFSMTCNPSEQRATCTTNACTLP